MKNWQITEWEPFDNLGPLMTAMTSGPTEGSLPDLKLMLKEFYELRGLNPEGIPRRDVLQALDLRLLAELFYKNCY